MTAESPALHGRGWAVDESARAALIATYDLEALRSTDALRQITDFAAALCDTPVALISLVEETRQTFIAHSGTDVTGTPRDISFCQFAMLGDDVMVVPDLSGDARFAANPLVTGELHLRSYAGAPLTSENGVPLGSLCVLSPEPRPAGLTALQRQGAADARRQRHGAAARHARRRRVAPCGERRPPLAE